MLFDRNGKKRKSRSVFATLLFPLILLVLVQALFLSVGFSMSGVQERLNQNEREIVKKQIATRGTYLENIMTETWSDVGILMGEINAAVQEMLDRGEITLAGMSSVEEEYDELLLRVSEDMISALYAKRASGIFIVLNTEPLAGEAVFSNHPGLYIRDFDPSSPPSAGYEDLLWEIAPVKVVYELNVSTDTDWQTLYRFSHEDGYADFLRNPYQAALNAESVTPETITDYGYWSAEPYFLNGSLYSSMAYSLPLVLEDGTVYGVLGVEVLTDYLKTMLPYRELNGDNIGSYVLAVEDASGDSWTPLVINGHFQVYAEDQLHLQPHENGGYHLRTGNREYFAELQELSLYNSNTPFSDRRWALIGIVEERGLYAFSSDMSRIFQLMFLLTLTIGFIGSFIVSKKISRPISILSDEVADAKKHLEGLPSLSKTYIQEIDEFSGAITDLTMDVICSSARFISIIEMASIEIGGFEVRKAERSVYVTKNFFALLGREDVLDEPLTLERFSAVMREICSIAESTAGADGSLLCHITSAGRSMRYIRIKLEENDVRVVGVAEDVTAATLERLRIEQERDYDLLTGLYNRRAFYRIVTRLFEQPEVLKTAALLMIDLDFLKVMNDRYGHDCGDQYIRFAGQRFAESRMANMLCSRVSGDEFYLFLYGYDSRDAVRAELAKLNERVQKSIFELPDGGTQRLGVSGGIAWYPEDSSSFHMLMKYADFAMYQVKRSHKGIFNEFDIAVYEQAAIQVQMRREFKTLVAQEQVNYHFQPIIEANTGHVYAYEALMRVNFQSIRSPETVIQIAREEGRLEDVERITWFKSFEAFHSLLKQKAVNPDSYLFVNSISGQSLSEADCEKLRCQYFELQPRVVIEVVESEDMNEEDLRAKRGMLSFSGLFALDDYGSGYNSEMNLLTLSPTYIKVDQSIIRGINADVDKRKIVSNIVDYAHERNMYIVAEGIETKEELYCVLKLGVDLLQGYFIARPEAVPGKIYDTALAVIEEFREKEKPGDLPR